MSVVMRNPYAYLRELCGLTQAEFEAASDMSHTTLTSIEAGLFPNLSDYMVQALGKVCHAKGIDAAMYLTNNYGADTLKVAYKVWQIGMRRANKSKLAIEPQPHGHSKQSPFDHWTRAVGGSRRGFCVLLCLPIASVMRYAEGKTRTMPAAVRVALADAGLTKAQLARIEELQAAWLADQ